MLGTNLLFSHALQTRGSGGEGNLQSAIYSHLRENIQDVFRERGIEIMSPHYRAQRDGSESTIRETNESKNKKFLVEAEVIWKVCTHCKRAAALYGTGRV